MTDVKIIGNGNIGNSLLKALNTYKHNIGNVNKINFELSSIKKDDQLNNIKSNSLIFLCLRSDNFSEEFLKVIKYYEEINCSLIFVQYTFPTGLSYKPQKHIRILPNINCSCNNGVTVVLKNKNNENYNFVLKLLGIMGRFIEVNNIEEFKSLSLITGLTPYFIADFYNKIIGISEKYITDGFHNQNQLFNDIFQDTIKNLNSDCNGDIGKYLSSVVTKNGKLESLLRNKEAVNNYEHINFIYKSLKDF